MDRDHQVKMSLFDSRHAFPLIIEPTADGLALADWAESNRESIESLLRKHGAILFRNFNLTTAADFEQIAQRLCRELFGDYGDLPRVNAGGKIYDATPYPQDQTILFHNESAHLHQWPLKIFFFCLEPPPTGGETPLASCREVYRNLDPMIVEQFQQRGVMYVRNFSSGLDISWEDFFNTADQAKVEQHCRETGVEFEWTGDGGLRTRRRCQTITLHPQTGEPVFFSQVQLYHQAYLEQSLRTALLSLFCEENLPRHVYYGDGSPIEDALMERIGTIYWAESVHFRWQKGDMLLLDNMLTAHARLPYQGPRKIMVAMGEMVRAEIAHQRR